MSLILSIPPEEMREKFLALKSARDVAALLEVKYSHLTYHLYKSTSSEKYITFTIPKRSGGEREIKAPISAIKILQRKLNTLLQQVYKHKEPVHSYIYKHSVISNARRHVNKKWVLTVDLSNFFPTISFQRIRGMFISKPHLLGEGAATVLAQLCCCDGFLPQGAPTSPIISNMICAKLDSELGRLSQKHKCRYTRYADDLTFSTNEAVFPESLAKEENGGRIVIGDELARVINDNWFIINDNKIRLRAYDTHQEATGLTVNEKVNVRRRYVKQIRAMLHSWERNGLEQAQTDYIQKHSTKKHRNPRKPSPEFKAVLYGKLAFLKQVIGENNPVYLRYFTQLQRLTLLEKYQKQKDNTDHRKRGLILERLMQKMFALNQVEVYKSFRRNENGEQIDGSCKYEGWYYLIECKWQEALSSHRDTDSLYAEIDRSGAGTWGIFISVNGWSDNVPDLLKQNRYKGIILMNGSDIEHVLRDRVKLGELIQAKEKHLHFKSEPYFDAANLVRTEGSPIG